MDGTSSVVLANAVLYLIPIGMFVRRKCAEKIRSPEKIQKHLVLLPPKCGKSTISKTLSANDGWIICDMDEDMRKYPEYEEYARCDADGRKVQAELLYFEMAQKLHKEVRARCRLHDVKALFFSSNYRISSLFKSDSVYALCPDAESWEARIMETPVEERDGLRLKRQQFLDALPSRDYAVSYHTNDELALAIRSRLNIRYKL